MRILHVVPALFRQGGGPSESVPMTAMAQKAAGLDVGIAFYDVGEPSLKALEAERAGVRLHRFQGRRTRWNPIAFSLDLVRRFEVLACDYDIVHTHLDWMFPIWWAVHVARKLGKPYVMMPRGSFAPARLKESAWKKRLVGWIDRRYAKSATAIWATAESEAEEIRAFVPGARVEVFPIGLDVKAYDAKCIRTDVAPHTLLYLSRLSPIKGLDLLAEAWSRLTTNHQPLTTNPWRLLIVGPDDRGYRAEIEKVFAAKCPLGSFEFRGPVFGAEKQALLSSVDAFVLPTRNENWGIAVAEAMAAGLPVICTRGAPWRCLETAGAGWWCDVSVDGLEEALKELLACPEERLREMGRRARAWVEENLDWGKIGARMADFYAEIRHGR